MTALLLTSFGDHRRSVVPQTIAGRIIHTREPGVKFLPRFAGLSGRVSNRPSVSQLESGSQGGLPPSEAPVFIIGVKGMSTGFSPSAITPVLKNAQPRTLPAGHETQRAFSFKVNPHVSSLSDGSTLPSFV